MDRPRVLSIDLLRAADVWLMLFVNEMAGVKGTPAFLLHKPPGVDGMTVTDVVFPAFLFITGMAVPLALGGRLRRGEPVRAVWRHVLARVGALLVMGVLMVNGETPSAAGLLPAPLWYVLMVVAVILVFTSPREGASAGAGRIVGVLLLLTVVFTYRAEGLTGLVQLRPRWWGILGLIGWAYLVASAAYLLFRDRPALLTGCAALLYLVALADEAEAIGALMALRRVVFVGRALGSHGALALTGVVLSLALLRHRDEDRPPRAFVAPAIGYGLGMAAAGLLLHSLRDLHPAFWINKPRATAAWCLLSAAFTTWAWVAAYALADVRGWRRWPKGLTMAGENALMIYLLAPLMLSLFALTTPLFGFNPYGALGGSLGSGIVRSVLFAWAVVRLSGWMRARGLRLHV